MVLNFAGLSPQGYDQKRKLFCINSFVHAHSSVMYHYHHYKCINIININICLRIDEKYNST